MKKTKNWKVASYARLSKDDLKKNQSASIANQVSIIRNYIKSQDDMILSSIFSDDGFTGANQERPDFQEMIEAIENGKINCVIVKDLSRLSRNTIEANKLVYRFFVAKHVRFISILENLDSLLHDFSDSTNGLIIPLRIMMNADYIERSSISTKSALQAKRKNGEFLSPFAPYGYEKIESENKLGIDEYASGIVERIFNDKLEGYSNLMIADRLNDENILCPYQYKKSLGLDYETPFSSEDHAKWTYNAISRILSNKVYKGDLVQGKRENISFNHKIVRFKTKSEWDIVKNTHEPIISHINFLLIQDLLKQDTRTSSKQNKIFLFSGFLLCAKCGQQMTVQHEKRANGLLRYYVCGTHKRLGNCHYNGIKEDDISELVVKGINKQIELLVNAQNFESKDFIALSSRRIMAIDKMIQQSYIKVEAYKELITKLYLDFKKDLIDKNQYMIIKETLQKDRDFHFKNGGNLETEKKQIYDSEDVKEFLIHVQKYKSVKTLSRKIITYFIKSISVESKEHIAIDYRFKSEIDDIGLITSSKMEVV